MLKFQNSYFLADTLLEVSLLVTHKNPLLHGIILVITESFLILFMKTRQKDEKRKSYL